MNSPRVPSLQNPAWKILATETARAVRSIFTIVATAWIIIALRDSTFAGARATLLVTTNRTLFVMAFFALWIWEFWFKKAKPHSLASDLR